MKLVLILLILILIIFAFERLDINGYKTVDIETLFSYSNFYDGKSICTEGFHVKSTTYNVLKTNLEGDEFKNSALLEYQKGKEATFDSLIPKESAARVKVCGKFESKRGKILSEFGVFNHRITAEQYSLLEKPKSFSF